MQEFEEIYDVSCEIVRIEAFLILFQNEFWGSWFSEKAVEFALQNIQIIFGMVKKEFLNICFKHSWLLFEILEVDVNFFKLRQFIQNSFDFVFQDGYIFFEGESPPRKFNFPQLNFEFDDRLSICIDNGGMDVILNAKHGFLCD